MVKALVKWLQVVMIMLDKEKNSAQDQLNILVREMLELAVDYQLELGINSFLSDHVDKIPQIASIMTGFIFLCRKNFPKIAELAYQLGGFDEERISKLIRFIKRYLKIFSKQGA